MSTTIDKIAWIRIVDRRVLTARSKGKTLFYVPGGKREEGESDEAALVREIREELSVGIVAGTLHHEGTFEAPADGKTHGVAVRMTCYRAEYVGEIAAAAEIEEVAWLTRADAHRCSRVVGQVLDALHAKGVID